MSEPEALTTRATVSVDVTCDKKRDQTPYFRASAPRLKQGEIGVEFEMEWKVKEGCKAVLVSIDHTDGGTIHTFTVSSNGKKASAVGVLNEGEEALVYDLCVQRVGAEFTELAFGQGRLESSIKRCGEHAVGPPEPPPKIIGPPSPGGGDATTARAGGADEPAKPVVVTVARKTWRGKGRTVRYFLAERARRPKGTRTLEVEFKLPEGCGVFSVQAVDGGRVAPPGSSRPSRNERRVQFEGNETFSYHVAITDEKTGQTCYAYGQKVEAEPTCVDPTSEVQGAPPPEPPPVIIGGP